MKPGAINMLAVPDEFLAFCDVSRFTTIFEAAISVPKDAKLLRGKSVLTFPKYDHDPTPNFLIPEIRAYVQRLDAALPYFLYFLDPRPELGTAFFWVACIQDPGKLRHLGEKTSIELESNTEDILVNRLFAIQRLCDAILDNFDSVAADLLRAFPRGFAESVWARLRRAK
jgi:hypothetical protein